MAAQDHIVYEPEWMIDASGAGSFRVECQCGWEKAGFDTVSSAKAAGFNHTTSGGVPPTAMAEPAGEPTKRRRFWRR